MAYRGHVKGGVVVLDDSVVLPEGTEVNVEPVTKPSQGQGTLADQFADLIGTVRDLPEDMAENHDHYIHGTPKK